MSTQQKQEQKKRSSVAKVAEPTASYGEWLYQHGEDHHREWEKLRLPSYIPPPVVKETTGWPWALQFQPDMFKFYSDAAPPTKDLSLPVISPSISEERLLSTLKKHEVLVTSIQTTRDESFPFRVFHRDMDLAKQAYSQLQKIVKQSPSEAEIDEQVKIQGGWAFFLITKAQSEVLAELATEDSATVDLTEYSAVSMDVEDIALEQEKNSFKLFLNKFGLAIPENIGIFDAGSTHWYYLEYERPEQVNPIYQALFKLLKATTIDTTTFKTQLTGASLLVSLEQYLALSSLPPPVVAASLVRPALRGQATFFSPSRGSRPKRKIDRAISHELPVESASEEGSGKRPRSCSGQY